MNKLQEEALAELIAYSKECAKTWNDLIIQSKEIKANMGTVLKWMKRRKEHQVYLNKLEALASLSKTTESDDLSGISSESEKPYMCSECGKFYSCEKCGCDNKCYERTAECDHNYVSELCMGVDITECTKCGDII